MFNEIQKRRVAERLATELDSASPEQVEKVGNLVFQVAALDISRDVDHLLDILDPESNSDDMVVKAAGICLTELAANNYFLASNEVLTLNIMASHKRRSRFISSSSTLLLSSFLSLH